MSQSLKISQLPASASAIGDEYVVARSGENFKIQPQLFKAPVTILSGAGSGLSPTGLVTGLIIDGDNAGATTGIEIVVPAGESGIIIVGEGTEGAQLSWNGSANQARVGAISVAGSVGLTYGNDVVGLLLNIDGDIGIGTTVPDGKMHIWSGNAGALTPNANYDDLIIENNDEAGVQIFFPDASRGHLVFGSPAGRDGAFMNFSQTTGQLQFGTGVAGGHIQFLSGAFAEAMRIDPTQRILIGHITGINIGGLGLARLQQHGDSSVSTAYTTTRWQANNNGPKHIFAKSRSAVIGTAGTPVVDADFLGSTLYVGDDGTDLSTIAAEIECRVNGTVTTGDVPGGLNFNVRAGGLLQTFMSVVGGYVDVGNLTDDPIVNTSRLNVVNNAWASCISMQSTAADGPEFRSHAHAVNLGAGQEIGVYSFIGSDDAEDQKHYAHIRAFKVATAVSNGHAGEISLWSKVAGSTTMEGLSLSANVLDFSASAITVQGTPGVSGTGTTITAVNGIVTVIAQENIMALVVEGVNEYREASVLVRLTVFGTWEHSVFGEQHIQQDATPAQIATYEAQGTPELKQAFA